MQRQPHLIDSFIIALLMMTFPILSVQLFSFPLISIADYSASVGSDLMREPAELLLPSFTVIALRSPPASPAQAAHGAANNINRAGGQRF